LDWNMANTFHKSRSEVEGKRHRIGERGCKEKGGTLNQSLTGEAFVGTIYFPSRLYNQPGIIQGGKKKKIREAIVGREGKIGEIFAVAARQELRRHPDGLDHPVRERGKPSAIVLKKENNPKKQEKRKKAAAREV